MSGIVSKFGGTSNATPEAVNQCVELSQGHVVTVLSAPGKLTAAQVEQYSEFVPDDPALFGDKVTDQLLGAHQYFIDTGEQSSVHTRSVQARYAMLVRGLGISSLEDEWLRDIPARIGTSVKNGKESTSMLGEILQTELYGALTGRKIADPTRAPRSLEPTDRSAWRRWLSHQRDSKTQLLMPGNIWHDGSRPRTFDRGGSDISGALAAFAVEADEYHNMTDTSCLSADPRMIARDRLLPITDLSYEEGRELGRNGSGLLHPLAIVPLMGSGIPTIVRNTFDPEARGTQYTDETPSDGRTGQVMALSLMKDVHIIEVHEPGMSERAGRIAAISKAVADKGVSVVDIVGHGADRQIVIVEGSEKQQPTRDAIKELINGDGTVTSESPSLLTLVGHDIGMNARKILNELAEHTDIDGQGLPTLTGRHSIRLAIPRTEAEQVTDTAHRILIESAV